MHEDLAPQPHQTATALPAHYYTDAAMAAVDRRAILDRSWQLLAHVSQLRETGDHIVADLGGLPVIAVRGADGAMTGFGFPEMLVKVTELASKGQMDRAQDIFDPPLRDGIGHQTVDGADDAHAITPIPGLPSSRHR